GNLTMPRPLRVAIVGSGPAGIYAADALLKSEEAARSAEPDPRRLVPLLLEAAQGVSDERRWDLVHALRVAGFAA
ncbi:hypothetical protein ABT082_36170, partial [Streptomyces massasporeus]